MANVAGGAERERRIAQLLGERYEIVSFLGKGGFAAVYKVRSRSLKRLEALKVLLEARSGDEEFAQRFRQEAELAASLDHPNIVRIYDFGQAQELFWYSMQLVNGPTLAHMLEQGPLEPMAAVKIAIPVLDALDYSHERGVIHRDIKPENLILDPQQRPYVMDFGIAKAEKGTVETRAGFVLGSPNYFSPEQALGEKLDGRTDVYAFGVTLYEMLCGSLPFTASDRFQAMLKRVREPPEPLGEKRPELANTLVAIVMSALERTRDARWGSARAMKEALEAYLADETVARAASPRALAPESSRAVPEEAPTAILRASEDRGLTAIVGDRSAVPTQLLSPPGEQAPATHRVEVTSPTAAVAVSAPEAIASRRRAPLVIWTGVGVAAVAAVIALLAVIAVSHRSAQERPAEVPIALPTTVPPRPTDIPPTAVPIPTPPEPTPFPTVAPRPTPIRIRREAEPPPPPPKRVAVKPPLEQEGPNPEFTYEMRRAYGGKGVTVALVIGEDGRVKSAHVVSGVAPEVDRLVQDTILQHHRYTPAQDSAGAPVESRTYVLVKIPPP